MKTKEQSVDLNSSENRCYRMELDSWSEHLSHSI